MAVQITLTLPDELYRSIERTAQLTDNDPNAMLLSVIKSAFPHHRQPVNYPNYAQCSDAELLELAEIEMNAEDDQRLSELLYQQQAGKITSAEIIELESLMDIYHATLLKKTAALEEAVKRGLNNRWQFPKRLNPI